MDEKSGEWEEEEVMDEGIGESMEELVYQNEVEGFDSRDMVKHTERSDQ